MILQVGTHFPLNHDWEKTKCLMPASFTLHLVSDPSFHESIECKKLLEWNVKGLPQIRY